MFQLMKISTNIKKSLITSTRFLSIKTLSTPNENALKFQIDQLILNKFENPNLKSSYQISLINQQQSPLACKIFEYSNDVESILIGSNFISVNKNEFAHWNQIKPLVESILENHLKNKEPIIDENYLSKEQGLDNSNLTEEEQEITDEIEELMETRIRPTIQEDGGDIIFLRYKDGKVYVQLQGACTSCSLSDDTLKSGIQSMLSHYIEEVEEVINLAEVEFNKFEEKLKTQREIR
ncbi:hypothetical protein WICMUC_000236 [Wickerhamomyces mucosus]|uniref:Scaffold protein Nfu/NifU N-terminal domain-containing protein n=1 Tax=Wickerhamomyces mucosus TaxID=1378264 RepID=A0A9P8PZS3_9ASCO|nr:hypothetical protein WICMUC_000236 [Wickerhamomyces mucosus]